MRQETIIRKLRAIELNLARNKFARRFVYICRPIYGQLFERLTGLNGAKIEISRECGGARCIMCNIWRSNTLMNGEKVSTPKMEFEQLKSVANQLWSLGATNVLLSGGEPFCYPKICEYIKYLKDVGFNVGAFTNGFPITEELTKSIVQSGIDTITFSLDGGGKSCTT